ncbi:MAG: OmpA family protein [Flavobacteriales bacterium]
MKFKTLATVLFIFSAFTFQAISQKNHARDAWNDYKNEKFYDAKEKFKIAAEKEKKPAKKAELYYMVGECYRHIIQPDQAEFFYKKALQDNAYNKSNEIYWHLAEAQREQATDKGKDKYKEAEKNFQLYFEKTGDKRGQEMAESCKRAQEWMGKPTRHIVTNETVINTENMDFSPTFLDRKSEFLIFTSSRPAGTGGEHDPHTGDYFTDLYQTQRDKKGKFAQPVPMTGGINTAFNEGAGVLDSRKQTFFFTRCPFEKKKNLGCDICETELKGSTWSAPKVLLELKPVCKGCDSVNVGHPALTADNKTMVFASNMSGGQGGRDLWITKYNNREKKWGTPENLGPQINTPGDELFPYISDEGDLYFSSDGHPGMGGLDMFKAKKIGENKWAEIENLKFPLNSPQHDFGIIFDGSESRGYFTSNRAVAGAKGRDDIYNFILPPLLFTLEIAVTDMLETPIPDADISVVGTDGTTYTAKSDGVGKYKFEILNDKRYINENTSYNLEVGHKKYYVEVIDPANPNKKEIQTKATSSFTTVGFEKSTDFYKEFRLQQITEKIVFHMPLILYPYNKWNLVVDPTGTSKENETKAPLNSKDSLNYLYDLMIKFPNWVVQLRSHTDSRGNDAFNEKLSKKRAQSCVDYLINEKGIDPKRLVAIGMGEREPIVTDAEIKAMQTVEEQNTAHQRNRRTDFKVIGFDYNPNPENTPTPPPSPQPSPQGK